jgi:hypothetical protein
VDSLSQGGGGSQYQQHQAIPQQPQRTHVGFIPVAAGSGVSTGTVDSSGSGGSGGSSGDGFGAGVPAGRGHATTLAHHAAAADRSRRA